MRRISVNIKSLNKKHMWMRWDGTKTKKSRCVTCHLIRIKSTGGTYYELNGTTYDLVPDCKQIEY